ncbi:MAG: hypothetical protein K2M76_00040, partial [Muribaculaceae bacterium]|nr:hypothetical protein [Muribaculaceae bacterium]
MSEKRQSFIALTLLYVVLLGAVGMLTTDPDGNFHVAKLRLATACVASLCMALPLAWIAMRHTAARIIISTVLWILFFIELFVFCHFSSRISFQVLDLVRHTNPGESSEFFSTHLFTIRTCFVIFICVCIATAYHLFRTWMCRVPTMRIVSTRTLRVITYIATAISAAVLACALFTSWFYYQLALPTIPQYIVAASGLSNLGDIQKQIERRLPMAEAHMTDSVPPAIVYVIGESFSRLHSPLYGYAKPTNPILSRALNDGHLLVFDSVATPSASTAHVMYNIFFTHTTIDTIPWYHTQLLPVLMHNAGYRVTLHDNQATRLLGDDVKGGDLFFFLNTHRIEQAAFEYRNSQLVRYDMDFIDAEADSMNICP